MKTSVVLTVALSLILLSSAWAQTIETFGLKVGGIHGEQNWEYHSQSPFRGITTDPLWGFDASSFIRFSINTGIGIQAELRYVQRGRSTTSMATVQANNPQGYIDTRPIETRYRFHYVDVPVLFQYRFGSQRIVPYLNLGPRVEYLFGVPDSPGYDQFATWEFGGTVAVGVELSIGPPMRLLAEASYDYNFTHSIANEYVTVRNRSLSFLLGVCF
jgi:hypothetical protein